MEQPLTKRPKHATAEWKYLATVYQNDCATAKTSEVKEGWLFKLPYTPEIVLMYPTSALQPIPIDNFHVILHNQYLLNLINSPEDSPIRLYGYVNAKDPSVLIGYALKYNEDRFQYHMNINNTIPNEVDVQKLLNNCFRKGPNIGLLSEIKRQSFTLTEYKHRIQQIETMADKVIHANTSTIQIGNTGWMFSSTCHALSAHTESIKPIECSGVVLECCSTSAKLMNMIDVVCNGLIDNMSRKSESKSDVSDNMSQKSTPLCVPSTLLIVDRDSLYYWKRHLKSHSIRVYTVFNSAGLDFPAHVLYNNDVIMVSCNSLRSTTYFDNKVKVLQEVLRKEDVFPIQTHLEIAARVVSTIDKSYCPMLPFECYTWNRVIYASQRGTASFPKMKSEHCNWYVTSDCSNNFAQKMTVACQTLGCVPELWTPHFVSTFIQERWIRILTTTHATCRTRANEEDEKDPLITFALISLKPWESHIMQEDFNGMTFPKLYQSFFGLDGKSPGEICDILNQRSAKKYQKVASALNNTFCNALVRGDSDELLQKRLDKKRKQLQQIIKIADYVDNVMHDLEEKKGGGDKCLLCLENDLDTVLVCGHLFCRVCLYRHMIMNTNESCPMCKCDVHLNSDIFSIEQTGARVNKLSNKEVYKSSLISVAVNIIQEITGVANNIGGVTTGNERESETGSGELVVIVGLRATHIWYMQEVLISHKQVPIVYRGSELECLETLEKVDRKEVSILLTHIQNMLRGEFYLPQIDHLVFLQPPNLPDYQYIMQNCTSQCKQVHILSTKDSTVESARLIRLLPETDLNSEFVSVEKD